MTDAAGGRETDPLAHVQLLRLAEQLEKSHPKATLVQVRVELSDNERTWTITRNRPRRTS